MTDSSSNGSDTDLSETEGESGVRTRNGSFTASQRANGAFPEGLRAVHRGGEARRCPNIVAGVIAGVVAAGTGGVAAGIFFGSVGAGVAAAAAAAALMTSAAAAVSDASGSGAFSEKKSD